jgi:hypothetical protein
MAFLVSFCPNSHCQNEGRAGGRCLSTCLRPTLALRIVGVKAPDGLSCARPAPGPLCNRSPPPRPAPAPPRHPGPEGCCRGAPAAPPSTGSRHCPPPGRAPVVGYRWPLAGPCPTPPFRPRRPLGAGEARGGASRPAPPSARACTSAGS